MTLDHTQAEKFGLTALAECSGTRISPVNYLPEERQTWAYSLKQLKTAIPKFACSEFKAAYVPTAHGQQISTVLVLPHYPDRPHAKVRLIAYLVGGALPL